MVLLPLEDHLELSMRREFLLSSGFSSHSDMTSTVEGNLINMV